MENKLSTGEFAKLCSTTKETLRHYKKSGILMPKYTEGNGYNYYSVEQHYDFQIIALLKMIGIPLKSIKRFIDENSAENALSVFESQSKIIKESIMRLNVVDFMLKSTIKNITQSKDLEADVMKIDFFEKEDLFVLPIEHFGLGKVKSFDDIPFAKIYEKFNELSLCEHAIIDYHFGTLLSSEDLMPQQLYIRSIHNYDSPFYQEKPAGHYLYYVKKGTWKIGDACKHFLQYIKDINIKTVGEVYLYDLSGFVLNTKEENAIIMLSIRLEQ